MPRAGAASAQVTLARVAGQALAARPCPAALGFFPGPDCTLTDML